jgi:3-oxoacyl-[acyl-carrier protein] reductase
MTYVNPGDVILVTGATGAIGFEIAAQAAAAGAIVAIHGSTVESVADAESRLKERVDDAQLICAPCDFRETGAIEAMVTEVARAGGRLDAVVHCAIAGAPGISGVFAQADPASFGNHAALVLGCFEQLCFFALPHLAKQGGTIVGFASDAGRFAAPRQSLVGGAFGGIMSFVRSLAVETARDGVRVHCISPTYVENTPVFDTYLANSNRVESARKRAGLGLPSPTDIAPMVLFLCGPGASKITGQIISINGGLSA